MPPTRGHALRLGLAFGCLGLAAVGLAAPELRDGLLRARDAWRPPIEAAPPDASDAAQRRITRLERELAGHLPRGAYLVVSTTDNRFELMRRGEVVREGLGSTGSYVQLQSHDGREWLFETPRGTFRIQSKRTNPVWVKPDWAFVEAGLPVPPLGSPERVERGVLGDYALALGDGYLIHGTLYQRLLGRPVTHGCVRLGDADLEAVYHALPVGARVFIY